MLLPAFPNSCFPHPAVGNHSPVSFCSPGIRRSLRNASLLVSLCLTISAFWCGYGVILVLAGQGVLAEPGGYHNALVPGLAAFTLALLLEAVVGFLCGEPVLPWWPPPCPWPVPMR